MQSSGNTGFQRRRLAILLTGALASAFAHADTVLDTVEVSARGNPDSEVVLPEAATPATQYRVDREAMRLFDTPGGSNPYTSVAEVPGVKVTPVDAWGLNNSQGGQKGMRVRGEVSTHGVSGTVEGLTLGGPGPGPGYLFLFDKENLRQVDFAQGAMSADRGGLFNTSGALDSKLRWPQAKAGGEIGLSLGSDGFQRAFLRADSGRLASGTAFFFSASHTQADKWRGHGEAPGDRENIELGISQHFDKLDIDVLYARNDQAQHNYRGLTYAEARDLSTYRRADYGVDPSRSDYYDFNRQKFRNEALLANIRYAFSGDTSFTFKPFYAKEKGKYLYEGSTAQQVQEWLLDHSTYGATAEIASRLAGTEVKFGHSWTSTEPPGPPTTRKLYKIVGGKLVFQRWALLSEVTDRHEFHSTYFTALRQFDRLKLNGSLRYARETLPAITAYDASTTTGASWDVSADAAADRATPVAARSVDSRSFGRWLPQLGASYQVTPLVELHVNAGQTIGGPSFDAFNQTPPAGFTSQWYWDQLKPEIATAIDIGARLRHDRFYLDPTVYYSRSKNKGVSAYDPATNTVWSQNVGKTEAFGFQLAAGWSPTTTLQLVSALSYSRSRFVEDMQTVGGAVLPVEGKQLPDVPKWMANLGAIWRYQGFTVAPMAQYVGKRWASSNYDQRVPGYWLADLTASYGRQTGWGRWTATVGVMNLFDRKYIGQISTSEINVNAGNRIFFPGAPRTLFASLNLGF